MSFSCKVALTSGGGLASVVTKAQDCSQIMKLQKKAAQGKLGSSDSGHVEEENVERVFKSNGLLGHCYNKLHSG